MKQMIAIVAIFLLTSTVCMADDWMKQLDDNAYLSQISIPGTHDSATGEGWTGTWGTMFGPSMGLTQELNIAGQLNCGVRAFDLRPCVDNDKLVINHGILQTKATFPGTLQQLVSFVKEHPTEFVIVIMRHETDGDDNNSQWGTMIYNCLNSSDIRPTLADYKRDITVGELRGKVLVLSRDSYADQPIGGFITGWAHQMNYATGKIKGPSITGTLYVQDFYEVMDKTTGKKNAIVKLLNFSTKNNVKNETQHLIVCINHTSGYTASASTDGNRNNAAISNQHMIDYLADDAHAGPTGIVVTDFAGINTSGDYEVKGLDLVNAIINDNQRYVPVKKENPMGINILDSKETPTATRHDLLGRKLNRATRLGIRIEKGRKVVVK